ncbi:hypothetical protein FJ970_28875 [Mesorhizobium sp. B2-1-8]|uniref:hypothetical protein n=1 Tax=unclassified Mesorhizobium TaxID=325217 RepID=UPI001AED6866|nr:MULTISPECIES: hypothetical protein [unclassified Mesorhizobium]MBZ9668544.1 hypothetical protein [Mesorhizobium sp. ES1-3]UCI19004.1 hypothetical protein FJ970_28875 [Mesorhizobium sp. B2-1-8]
MEQSGIDFGVFTCDPPLAGFYARAGAWLIMPDAVLIGSRARDALRSDTLGKVVLTRLFSSKAITAELEITHSTVELDLPVGQFWQARI